MEVHPPSHEAATLPSASRAPSPPHHHHPAPDDTPASLPTDDQGPIPASLASNVIEPTPSDHHHLPATTQWVHLTNTTSNQPSPPQKTPSISPEPPASPNNWEASSALSEPRPTDCPIDHDYDGPQDHSVLRLKPTIDQWNDFPSILSFARHLGADEDGCFKVILPQELLEDLPEKAPQTVPANAYRPTQIKKNSFWRVDTVPSEGIFTPSVTGPESTASATEAIEQLRKMFRKNDHKQIRNVRYRVDVPAWTADQRREAGVPEQSPIHPLKGDKLDHTKAIIPGIHTPYVYESGPYFGASFQIHAEDFRLVSLNHLYKGRKIWIVVPSTSVNVAEEALGRKDKCSQFMRHRAEFFFPQKLEKLGIPFRIVDQRPGETIVILPDAYHEGFSTGYTIAEAKNYADAAWTTDTYQPCEKKCKLATAIPADLMRPLKEGETQVNLCPGYELISQQQTRIASEPSETAKRRFESEEQDNGNSKRVKG
ncbi:hypothetical protein ACJ41O_002170 [Fusarium nematophilum]